MSATNMDDADSCVYSINDEPMGNTCREDPEERVNSEASSRLMLSVSMDSGIHEHSTERQGCRKTRCNRWVKNSICNPVTWAFVVTVVVITVWICKVTNVTSNEKSKEVCLIIDFKNLLIKNKI